MTSFLLRKLLLLLLLASNSCMLLGEQPDKRVTAIIELSNETANQEQIDIAITALKHRFQKFGGTTNVKQLQNSSSISLIIETAASEESVLQLLQTRGTLHFYDVIGMDEIFQFFSSANQLIFEADMREENPLLNKIAASGYERGPILFYVAERDTSVVGQILRKNEVRQLLPAELHGVKFLWGIKDTSEETFPLYAVLGNKAGNPLLDGTVIEQASMSFSQLGLPVVDIAMNQIGSEKWADLTEKAFKNQSEIAIVIDNVVYSAPGVTAGPIHGGRSQISGDFSEEEAKVLAIVLNSGTTPSFKLLQHTVEPLK